MVMVSPAAPSASTASGSASRPPSSSADLHSKPPGGKQSSAAAAEGNGASVRLWPPSSRTRSHVIDRLVENLKSLSSFYQPLEPDEASRIAALLEQSAFEEGEHEDRQASRVSDTATNGSSAVRVYARQASRMILEVVKTGKIPDKGKASDQKADEKCVENGGENQRGEESVQDTAASAVERDLFDISNRDREVLDLIKCDDVFRPLADPKNGYTKVRLSNWGFTKEAAQYAGNLLFGLKNKLVSVDMSDIVAGRPEDEALEVMKILSAALEGAKLSSLNLSNNALGEKGVRAFELLLKSQKSLTELWFENIGASPDAARAIVELVSGTRLKLLHFHNNMTGDAGAEWLAKLISQATELEDFKISSSRVGCRGAVALCKALQGCSRLRKLDLRDNMFKDAGEALGQAVKHMPALEELYLCDLGLEDEGVQQVMEALEKSAPKLTVLDLENNEISVSGAGVVAKFLETKPGLKKLNLTENELGDKGVILISKALREKNEDLEELDLTLNEFGAEGAIAAAKAVAKKARFERLILESNHVSRKGLAEVESVLENGVGKSVLVPLDDNDPRDEDEDEEDGDENEEEIGDSELELQKRVDSLCI